jgi:hypothetical protein
MAARRAEPTIVAPEVVARILAYRVAGGSLSAITERWHLTPAEARAVLSAQSKMRPVGRCVVVVPFSCPAGGAVGCGRDGLFWSLGVVRRRAGVMPRRPFRSRLPPSPGGLWGGARVFTWVRASRPAGPPFVPRLLKAAPHPGPFRTVGKKRGNSPSVDSTGRWVG